MTPEIWTSRKVVNLLRAEAKKGLKKEQVIVTRGRSATPTKGNDSWQS